jgi:predicted membrane channel-forming protein YqfA (hemolysin III family)
MLKKLAAVLLGVGLCLPYSCDFRPITSSWGSVQVILFIGLPVIAAVAYVLHNLLPPLAAFHERHGRTLYDLLRVLYLLLAGSYLTFALTRKADWPGLLPVAAAIVVTGVLLAWQQRRGTKATRVPFLFLLFAGVPAIAYAVELRTDLRVGAWLSLSGWALGVLAESLILRVQPTIAHGG